MKNILDKINKADEIQAKKTELGTHEVELASIDDIQNRYSQLYSKHFGKADTLISQAKNELKTFVDAITNLEKEGVDIAKKAKELGINADSIPNYTNVMKRLARDKGQAMEDVTKTLAKYR